MSLKNATARELDDGRYELESPGWRPGIFVSSNLVERVVETGTDEALLFKPEPRFDSILEFLGIKYLARPFASAVIA